MTSAKGSFDFLRRECVVGKALSVDRMYFGGQLASSEGVQLELGGRMMGGGGKSSSETLKGWFIRSVGYSWFRGPTRP